MTVREERGPSEGGLIAEREEPLREVAGTVEAAAGGSGASLRIVGVPGAGKTTLLEAARARQERAGKPTWLAATGSETGRNAPFGVVRTLLGEPLERLSETERERLLSGAAGLAAPVFDAGAGRWSLGEGLDPAAIRHGLYWLVAGLAEAGPIVLVVDDMQWADEASRLWLRELAGRLRELPVSVIVATRPPAPSDPADSLPPADRIVTLAELSLEATATLLKAKLGRAPDRAFAAACRHASHGNPLLLGELIDRVRTQGLAPVAEAAEQVRGLHPAGVEDAIAERLAGLPQACVELARAVAVLGECELRLAAELAGIEPASGVEAADRLHAADVLGTDRPLRFRHPLVRSAVYARIPARRRAATHARAAALIAAETGDVERAAGHLLESDPMGSPWAGEALRKAAALARSRGDLDAALRLLRRAVAEPPPEPERATTLLALGRLESELDEGTAVEHLRRAAELAGSTAIRGEATLALHHALLTRFRWNEAAALIDEALTEMPSGDGGLARKLEVELISSSRLNRETRPAALGRLARLEPPREPVSVEDRLLLAICAHEGELRNDPAGQVAAQADAALAAGTLLGELGPEAPALYYAGQALAACDHLDAAERTYEAARAEAQRRGSVVGFVLSCCFLSGAAIRRGAIGEAEGEARAALEASQSGWRPGSPAPVAFLVTALIERGELEEAERLAAEAGGEEEIPDSMATNHLLLNRGRLRVALGSTEEGLDDLLEFGRRIEGWGVRSPAAFPWRSDAAEAMLVLGDRERARELAAEELDLADAFGAARARGISLRTLGRARGGTRGLKLLRRAVGLLEESPFELDLARVRLALGELLVERDAGEDAREPLRAALDAATRLDAAALAERARDALRASGARPRRAAQTGWGALTPSQRKVCELAAAGRKNAEIAQDLFVTLATVEAHLTGAYRKLEIKGRVDLATAIEAPQG